MLYVLIIILSLILIWAGFIVFTKIKRMPKIKREKPAKKEKEVKVKKVKSKNEEFFDLKGASVDTVDKFLYRKEIKLLVLINKILPKGFIVFPKIGIDLVLAPVGNKSLYDTIRGKYLDLVVFEEITMKPRLAIDLHDGTIGDEQLEIDSPEVINALKIAELPLISFKIKTDYELDEIKIPILKGLGLENKININNEEIK